MSNQYDNHRISQADFIRKYLSTNSMKQFWYKINESEILINREYTESTLSRIDDLYSQGVYVEDRRNIVSRIEYLRNSNKNTESVEDLLLNSISSFSITISSQGGNPKFLYEDYKLKEFFKHLAKNGIEVSFKVKNQIILDEILKLP